jgi:protein-S-isoprenylcysteine O-methyltransferase Ste14
LLPVCYVVFRKPSDKMSTRPSDWMFALAGSAMPLLIHSTLTDPIVPPILCYGLVIIGLFTQVSAKIVLGRSFGIVAANRGVKSVGPYRLIRHPMYAGYTMTHIGLWLAAPSLFNALLYVIALLLQIARILREERVLRQDPAYQALVARVPYRLLPGVF